MDFRLTCNLAAKDVAHRIADGDAQVKGGQPPRLGRRRRIVVCI